MELVTYFETNCLAGRFPNARQIRAYCMAKKKDQTHVLEDLKRLFSE